MFQAKSNQKRAGMAILTADKTTVRTNAVTKDRGTRYIDQISTQRENRAIINTHASHSRALSTPLPGQWPMRVNTGSISRPACFRAMYCALPMFAHSWFPTGDHRESRHVGPGNCHRASGCWLSSALPTTPSKSLRPFFDIFGPVMKMRMKVFRTCGQLRSPLPSTSRGQGLVAAQQGIWKAKFGCIMEGHPVWLTHVPYGMLKPGVGRGPEEGHTAS